MDPLTTTIITGLATNYFSHFTAPVVQNFFETVFRRTPSLADDLKHAQSSYDFERIFREAVGVIDAGAADGTISIDTALLSALRGIRFDHQRGLVTILGSTLSASVLQTGGTAASTGQTVVSDSVLKSQGTAIHVGKGASIKITGGASVRQT